MSAEQMTEIEKKALELVNEVVGSGSWTLTSLSHPYNRVVFTALCRAIEQHEAYKQEVSDVLLIYSPENRNPALGRFIIPKPTVDPLVEVLDQLNVGNGWDDTEDYARRVYEALAKRGLKIVEAFTRSSDT